MPAEYRSLPLLTGRAKVEFTVRRGGSGQPFVLDNVNGTKNEATFVITGDVTCIVPSGRSSRYSCGNFGHSVLFLALHRAGSSVLVRCSTARRLPIHSMQAAKPPACAAADGFSAPVSAGAFVKAALSGSFTGKDVSVSQPNLFIGDAEGPLIPLENRPQVGGGWGETGTL